MTTVQIPKPMTKVFARFQVHKRQPFYEVIMAGMVRLASAAPPTARPAPPGDDVPP